MTANIPTGSSAHFCKMGTAFWKNVSNRKFCFIHQMYFLNRQNRLTKATVFPEPVLLPPIQSRPFKISGMHPSWILVGFLIARFARDATIHGRTPISANEFLWAVKGVTFDSVEGTGFCIPKSPLLICSSCFASETDGSTEIGGLNFRLFVSRKSVADSMIHKTFLYLACSTTLFSTICRKWEIKNFDTPGELFLRQCEARRLQMVLMEVSLDKSGLKWRVWAVAHVTSILPRRLSLTNRGLPETQSPRNDRSRTFV